MDIDFGRRLRCVMRGSRKTLTTSCAVFALATFSGCGGGGADVPSDGFECLFANCKDSPDVAVADINGTYEVVQEGARITATSTLGYRSNLLGFVRLGGSDSLT